MYSPLNWAEAFTTVATCMVALTGVAALGYAWRELGQSHKQDQVKHLLEFDRRYSEEPLIGYRCALAEKRLKGEHEPDELYLILDFFDTVGLLVTKKCLDEVDVWSTFGYPVIIIFSDFQDVLRDFLRDDPTNYCEFTSLAKRMKKVERLKEGTSESPSPDEITDYWEDERKKSGHATSKRSTKRKKKPHPGVEGSIPTIPAT
jgi:hypothetical protein